MININDPEPSRVVLGTVLTWNGSFDEVQDYLIAKDFYSERDRELWTVFKECVIENTEISPVAVIERAKSKLINMAYLVELMNSYPDPGKIFEHATMVKKQSLARQGINIFRDQIQQLTNGEEPDEVMSKGSLELSEMLDKHSTQDKINYIGDNCLEFVENLEEKMKSGKSIIGLKTGYDDLDYVLGGLDPDTITILAARPGTGKTTFSLNVAKHIAENYGPVYFGSLEMSRDQLKGKMLAQESQVDSMAFRNVRLLKMTDIDKLTRAAADINELKIIVDDSTEMKASQILVRLRKLKKKLGIKAAVIDYLQLIEPEKESGNTRQDINRTLRVIKKITRAVNIPLILICQLNREVEKRKNPKPIMSDLNESGNIEQVASAILFLWQDPKNPPELITGTIAKNRYGPSDFDLKFKFDKKTSQFVTDSYPRVKV